MTVIAAIKDAEHIYYGADSRVTYDSGPAYDVCTKWRAVPSRHFDEPILIGAAGSGRLDSIIVSSSKILETCMTPFEIADVLKRAVISDSWREAKGEDGAPQDYSVEIIVILNNELFRISSDFSVTPIPDLTLVAVGSGEPYALGAGYAARNKSCKEQVRTSIQAAIKYDPNCGGKIQVGEIEL